MKLHLWLIAVQASLLHILELFDDLESVQILLLYTIVQSDIDKPQQALLVDCFGLEILHVASLLDTANYIHQVPIEL